MNFNQPRGVCLECGGLTPLSCKIPFDFVRLGTSSLWIQLQYTHGSRCTRRMGPSWTHTLARALPCRHRQCERLHRRMVGKWRHQDGGFEVERRLTRARSMWELVRNGTCTNGRRLTRDWPIRELTVDDKLTAANTRQVSGMTRLTPKPWHGYPNEECL